MQKLLKLTGVSVLTIVAATGANAAGYTCEELIEYTSCNDGYYLNSGDCIEGTTCGAGNYLVGTCPSDYYVEDPDGDVLVRFEWGTNWCDMDDRFFYAASEEECTSKFDEEDNIRGVWYGMGCAGRNIEGVFVAAESYTCTSCASGTYQPSAGQYSCITCPAGSECPTTTAATLCEIGTYSFAGATACTSCPATELTDINGATVVATTVSTGSDSVVACIVGPDVQFKNDAGIYHFKSNCTYGGISLNISITTPAECEAIGESWSDDENLCYVSDVKKYLPTKEVCEMWRNTITYEDYRNSITCFEDGGATCYGAWYFDGNGLQCDW